MTALGDLRDALVDAVLVVGGGARLLWRHGAALVTLCLLGLAARNAAMWGAVLLGREHPVLASLLVPLAPLSVVVALILMMRTVRPSTRWAAGEQEPGSRERLTLLASALVPFLTVYALQGHLDQDRNQFINESYADEFRTGDLLSGGGLDDRTLVTVASWQITLVVVALLLRTVLDRLQLADRHAAWGFVAALVEVTWLTWLAALVTTRVSRARDWARGRVVVTEVADAWHRLTGALGPLTGPVRAVGDLVTGVVEQVGAVVVTPVAWLTVGAVVLVGGLHERRRRGLEEHAAVVRARGRFERSRLAAWRPRQLGEVLGRRFEELVDGLRTIAHAGVLPVLAFCLVLGLPTLAQWGAALLLRTLVGPQDPDLMLSLSPYLDVATRTVYTVLVVALVAAAVDRLLARRLREPNVTPPAALSAAP